MESGSSKFVNEIAIDMVDLNRRTVPNPQTPLSASTTSDDTIDLSILATTETTVNESEVHSEVPHAEIALANS